MTVRARTGAAGRPHDRKARIVEAAAVLFRRSGYHQVGMEDIASAVGITAGGLYRHFRGKQELLEAVVVSEIGKYEDVARAAGTSPDAAVRALARHVLDHRDHGPWWLLSRDLSAEHRSRVRLRLRSLAAIVAGQLQTARPELADTDADPLSWAVLAVLGSPFEHRVALPRPRFEALQCTLALALCRTVRLPVRPSARATPAAGDGMIPGSRREALLNTAARLFQERGFDGVSMDTIGAAAGIAGPSIYKHFTSKADLLAAVFDRGAQVFQLSLMQALAVAGSPAQALERAVRSHVATVLRPGGAPGLLYSESIHLPAEQLRAARRFQRDYIAAWARLLPIGPAEGRVAVQAAISMIDGLALTPHLRDRPGLADEIAGLAMDVLTAAAATPS